MMISRLRAAHLLGGLVAATGLAVALGTERWGGLVPCALCLLERWPYRAGILIALAGLIVPRGWSYRLLLLLAVTFGASAALAGLHAGVERGWWPSPLPQCEAPRIDPGLSAAQRLARMPLHPSKSCEDATYLIPAVPVSMAESNLLLSLVLALGLAMLAWRTRRSEE